MGLLIMKDDLRPLAWNFYRMMRKDDDTRYVEGFPFSVFFEIVHCKRDWIFTVTVTLVGEKSRMKFVRRFD